MAMSFFSNNLKAHIESKGLNAYKLSKLLASQPEGERLSEQYLYAVLRGDKTPNRVEVLEKLSKALSLSLNTLKAWL